MVLNVTDNSSFTQYCQYNPEDPSCWYDAVPPPFKLTPGKIISAIAMALLIIVALGGNILLCTAFFVYRRLRKTTNYFIISLALSDILVATVAMPMWLSYEVSAWQSLPIWIDFATLLRFWNWFDILAGVSSITNLTAISIDRCLSIMTPLLHRTRMTDKIAIIMILIAWLYSLVLAFLSLAELQHYTALVAALGFFVPLLIIVVSYLIIYGRVKTGGYSTTSDKDWNLERTLIIVISVFVICWLPFFCFTLTYHYCLSCEFDENQLPHLVSFTKWMHYLNSGCNPFIYGLFNQNFKNAFRALIRHCYVPRQSEVDRTTTQVGDGTASSLRCQIIGLGRKLRLKRRARDSNFLLSDADTGSICVTMVPGNTSNRNSRSLLHMDNAADDAVGYIAEDNNPLPRSGHNWKSSGENAPGDGTTRTVREPLDSDNDDVTEGLPIVKNSFDSQVDSEGGSFLQSHKSQESCV